VHVCIIVRVHVRVYVRVIIVNIRVYLAHCTVFVHAY
jgi:hypothetical protein